MSPAAYATFRSTQPAPHPEAAKKPAEIPETIDPALAKMVAEHQRANYNEPEAEPRFYFAIRKLNVLA